ncbi:MAG: D-glycero-beta-D-manno-heptose 1,7-bisphosphate 7-phosphatase [Pseudomonadales bacterium]|nr:D-glycero-beta-D-manno-heptose 1,7-bisphosphate 7-phosphatase [Pseudomonadales bacterium]
MSDHANSNWDRGGPAPRRLILLDRDGVINFDSPAFIRSVSDWRPIPGALEAIARLHHRGFQIGVCTNQSGIGRGLLTEATLLEIHARIDRELAAMGAGIHAWRYCPHLPEAGCSCRKPRPGMLLDLIATFAANAADTCFVGDSLRDLQSAQAAGCEPVLVRTGHGQAAEAEARSSGVTRIYDDLQAFATAEIEALGKPADGLQHK